MRYRNLDLDAFDYRVVDGVERFRVRVVSSPAGEQRIADAEGVSLPPDVRDRLRRLERRQLRLAEMIRLGEDLAAALFPPRARAFLERSRERLREDEGLRIRLRLDTYALADLPWEYVYIARADTPADQKGPEGFVVLARRLSLVRYEVLGQAPGTLEPVGTAPLRLVALMANPAEPGYPVLQLESEQAHIQSLAEVAGIDAEFHADATVKTLERALTREAHVFHFAGHGRFVGDLGQAYGSLEGAGSIVLLDEEGRAAPLPAEKLALNLADRGVRLAVLGACEGGRRDGQNAWTGVAPALIHLGIPAVVGMQYSIRDANAIAFSRRFYTGLTEGQPVDAAVTDGRLAILNRGEADERDWGVPVLYLRAEEGVLFPRPAELRPFPARAFSTLLDLARRYVSVLALLGVSLSQVLNLRPSDQSGYAFILFSTLALLVVAYCAVILIRPTLLKRGGRVTGERAEVRRRRLAALGVILTPLVYAPLALFLHVPNTWPMRVGAGAESRESNPWLRTVPGGSLLGLGEKVGFLFAPDPSEFTFSQAVHRVTIDNRSTAPSPPLNLVLIFQKPQETWPWPARVSMAAVVSPAVRGWRPLGNLRARPTTPEWFRYVGSCRGVPSEREWCFVDPPADKSTWREPEFRLPSIPPRGGVEVYLELAFPKAAPAQTIPALIVLRSAAERAFAVGLRCHVDLNAGVGRRCWR